MLGPQDIGRGRAALDAVRVLDIGVVLALGRHEKRLHARGARAPACTAIGRAPGTAAADADQHLAGRLRMRADRMDAWRVVAAAKPFQSLLAVPERFDQLPAFATIAAAEQAAGNGARPDMARRVALQRPDLHQLPGGPRCALGLHREAGRGQLSPGLAAIVRAMQLDAEVPQVQGGEHALPRRSWQHHRDRLGNEIQLGDLPAPATFTAQLEQALAGGDPGGLTHDAVILQTRLAAHGPGCRLEEYR